MIIGISGKRGVGKTTGANHLVKKYNFIKVSFAEDLKLAAKQLFPFTEVDFTSVKRKEAKYKMYDWSPRDFLINLGEFMRYHDKSYWLNRAMAKCADTTKNYVFDDLRYENEAEAIKAMGGKIVRIGRYPKQNPYGKDLDIASETSLDTYKWDYEIPAMWNMTLTDLYRKLDGVMEEVSPT